MGTLLFFAVKAVLQLSVHAMLQISSTISKFCVAYLVVMVVGLAPAYAAAAATHYDLTVEVKPSTHSLRVSGRWSVPHADLTATSNKDAEQKQFRFVSSEKLRELRLTLGGSPVKVNCAPFDGQLECMASFRAATISQYTFGLSYKSDGKPVAQLRIDQDQAFAGSSGDYWYPQLSYAQGDTGELRFIVPSNFEVVAPGELIQKVVEGDHKSFRYKVPVATKFGFAAAPFRVMGGGKCTLYLQHDELRAAKILEGCANTAAALTRIWGPFPGGGIKLVEVDFKSALLGIGERGYILADSSQIHRDFDISYWAHEMSHQWWGNLVRAKYPSPGATLLTEGMAEFGALVANRELNGKSGEAYYLSDHYTHEPNGAPMAHYLSVVARHEDIALVASNQGADASQLHYLATSKGTMAIDMLSNEVGPDRFRRIVAQFLKTHAGQSTTWAEFEEFIGRTAGQKLDWFYAQWFDRPGMPLVYSTWTKQADGIDITLHQCGQPYRLDAFPFEVRSEDAAGNLASRVFVANVRGAETKFHIQTKGDVYRVNPDPGHSFLWLPGVGC